MQFSANEEGYYDFVQNRYIYTYKDHLGNLRLSYYKQTDGTAKVLEENHYYPFGLRHTGYTPVLSNNTFRYKYNGKEVQENGMYDYGARMYMPEIARWGVMDPLAEQYRAWSLYNYAVNNPVSFIDPDGRSVQYANGGLNFTEDSAVAFGALLLGQAQAHNAAGGSKIDRISAFEETGGGGGPLDLGITGSFAQAAFDLLKQSVDGQLKLTFENGIVSGSAVEGATLSEAANWLLEAINNPDIKVTLETIEGFYFYDTFTKKDTRIEGDGFRGSYERNGKLFAKNYLSTDVSSVIDKLAGSPIGTTPLHAVLEAYIGAKYFPDSYKEAPFNNNIKYLVSHDWAACIDKNYKDLPQNFRFNPGLEVVNGKIRSYTPFYYDVNTKEVIHQFKTYKYSK